MGLTGGQEKFLNRLLCIDFGSSKIQDCRRGTHFSSVLGECNSEAWKQNSQNTVLSLFFNKRNKADLFHSIKKGQEWNFITKL